MLELLIAILLLVAVAVWISVPLRRREAPVEPSLEDPVLAELEARKQAKYREIRDTEMDYRTGKLSDADWRALDRSLRGEAVEILRRLDELDGTTPDED